MGKYLITYDFTTDAPCGEHYNRIIDEFDKHFSKSDMKNIWISEFTSEKKQKRCLLKLNKF